MNYAVFDKRRWESFGSDNTRRVNYLSKVIMNLDFVFIKNDKDSYEVIKNRHNGLNYQNVNWKVCEELMSGFSSLS